MAVFERERSAKLTLDDSIPLYCFIETSQNVKDHTEYVIRVQRGPLVDKSWKIMKRYSDFVTLDNYLKFTTVELVLPPKRVFGNKEREFIAERQRGLQNYLNSILSYPCLANCLEVKRFLDYDNYRENFMERALEQVSMMFRADPTWQVVEAIPDIGWRIRKEYVLTRQVANSKARYVLSWTVYGPDAPLGDKYFQSSLELLSQFQHDFIGKVDRVLSNSSGALVVREFYEGGTLKDIIYKSKPKVSYLKKYASIKKCTPLDYVTIRTYSKQIITTLKYLYEKGYCYGHLHTGNIAVVDGKCKLLDLENFLLGVPSQYRPYYTQYRKIQTLEQIDVYNFGHTLYEMAVGKPLMSPICQSFPIECQPDIRSILESILTSEACKNGLPTLDQLLQHPFLSSAPHISITKPIIKIPRKLKESLREAELNFEARLREEQKTISQQRKIEKSRDFHMSDTEKQKRKKALKKSGSIMEKSSENSSNIIEETPKQNGAATPPSVPQAPPPPAPVPSNISSETPKSPPEDSNRSAFLGSIASFNKTGLKKTATVDKSAPKL